MTGNTLFQQLGDETRPFFEQYCSIIEPYRNELWGYCRKITGSPWEAEDLYQETVLKLFTSLSSISSRSQPIHPRSYLYRVATNLWIDQCRKSKVILNEFIDEIKHDKTSTQDPMEVYETFEVLIQNLPPRQIAVIVLIDAFKFTARETAELIGTTEGAINALLYRARRNLKIMRDSNVPSNTRKSTESNCVNDIINLYVSLFNKRDFNGIAQLISDNAVYSFVTQDSKEYGKDTIMKASHNPSNYERKDLIAYVQEIWGKQAVIFAKVTADGKLIALNEVLTIEIDDGMIVRINGHYFCPNLMEAASQELGLPRDQWDWAK